MKPAGHLNRQRKVRQLPACCQHPAGDDDEDDDDDDDDGNDADDQIRQNEWNEN